MPDPRTADPASAKSLPAKIYLVMAVTAVTTFAALTTVHELFFTRQLFA